MLSRDDVGAAVVGGLGTVGSGFVVLQLFGAPAIEQVQWLFCIASAAGLGIYTTKGPGGGVGMGLATSREYLRRAGGDLLADQRPGGGARFTLALRSAP